MIDLLFLPLLSWVDCLLRSSQAVFRISDGLAGWYLPASARREMARRFPTIMRAPANIPVVISIYFKSLDAPSETATGPWGTAIPAEPLSPAQARRSPAV